MPTKRVPLPLVGGSEKNLPGQSGRVLNLYPESTGANGKAPFVLKHVPGSFRRYDLSAGDEIDTVPGDIRGMHVMGTRAFVAAGNYIIELNPPSLGTFTVLARLSTFNGPVGFSDNAGTLVIGDGRFWTLVPGSGALTPVLNDATEQLRGYISRYINGTTLYFIRGTEQYYYSEVGDASTVLGLSFFSAEGNPDKILNAWVVNSEIIILGERSTEWHWNSGDADNPFQRISGGYIEHGTVGMRASCKFDNSVVMVGRNDEGQGIVWRLGPAGSAPQRVSTHPFEQSIGKVLFNDLADDITMYGYQDEGHSFFFVNLPAADETTNSPAAPSMTRGFDAATGEWHERASRNVATGRFERQLGDYHIAWMGRHYVGDHLNPHVYEFSRNYFRENTIPLVKLVQTQGPLNIAGQRFRVLGIELQLKVGVGRDGDADSGHNPQVVGRFSWDGGNTWGDEVIRPIGRIGAYDTTVNFGPCGAGRNFVAEFFISDPVDTCFSGAWASVAA